MTWRPMTFGRKAALAGAIHLIVVILLAIARNTSLLKMEDILFFLGTGLLAFMWFLLFRKDIRSLARCLGRQMAWWRALCLTVGMLLGLRAFTSLLIVAWFTVSDRCSATLSVLPFAESSVTDVFDVVSVVTRELRRCIFTPVVEEITFRFVLFRLLQRRIGTWPAIFVGSLLFGALHAYSSSPAIPALKATLIGVGASLLLLCTRRLHWCILLHSGANILVALAQYWPSFVLFHF